MFGSFSIGEVTLGLIGRGCKVALLNRFLSRYRRCASMFSQRFLSGSPGPGSREGGPLLAARERDMKVQDGIDDKMLYS